MKKLLSFVICCLVAGFAMAQTAPFMNYQGVARNTTGQPLANQAIVVKSTILSDNPVANKIRYIEIRPVTTNQFGLFSFQLGNPTGATVIPLGQPGIPLGTEYFVIPWDSLANPRLSIGVSTNNGSSFTDLGTSTLMNVPYANVANFAHSAAPWAITNSTNSIITDRPGWNLGLGTTGTPTEKLHVVGKIRMVDGNQADGKILSSDANGVATWKAPIWTKVPYGLPSNNFSKIYLTDSTRTDVGIGTSNPQASLHVLGRLKLEIGDEGIDKVLTSDATGYALWKDIASLPSAIWKKQDASITGHPGQFITRSADSSTFLLIKNPTQISPTANSEFQLNNWLDPNSYALNVRSPNDYGVAIGLPGTSNNDKKFVTFFDQTGVKGRIEGQTFDEIMNSRDYILFNFFQTTILAEYIAEGVAAGFQLDLFEVAVNAAAATALGIQWAIQVDDWQANAGVAYESGSGDYAEWLQKNNPAEKFSFGDIVEVNGGRISKTITGAGQLMVISMAPIVLGNTPDPGKEKLSEKVAFMGQVPVKVTGNVTIGDYIVSSGNNDGIGYAVHPSDITPEEYKHMVGVAWSKSSGKIISLINTAVGLKTNAVVDMVKKQEEKTNTLTSQLNQMGAYLATKDPSFTFQAFATTAPVFSKGVSAPVTKAVTTNNGTLTGNKKFLDVMKQAGSTLTAAKVKKMITDYPEEVTKTWKYFQKTISENAKIQNFDLNKNPELKRLVNDRDAFIDNIKKAYGIVD